MTPATYDDAADQQLKLLVGLVVVSGLGSLALGISQLTLAPDLFGVCLALAALFAASNWLLVRVRIGATYQDLSPAAAVALVSTVFLPAGWMIVSTTIGMAACVLIKRQRPLKVGFNVGKEALAAGAAAGAMHLIGPDPILVGTQHPIRDWALGLAAAALCYELVDQACSHPLFAIVTRTNLRQRVLENLDVRLLGQLIALLIAFLTVWAYLLQPWLVLALPFLVYGMHLTSASQVRARTEREAWQRLAQATDELNIVDLDRVVTAAIVRASELFSADEVELEVRTPLVPPRLARGTAYGVTFEGSPDDAPAAGGYVIATTLNGYGGNADIGELRLRFGGEIELSERERYTLRTFAAALYTAIRNATMFTETRRLASDYARAAAQDPLTSLANRRKLYEYGEKVLAAQPPTGLTALLLIDLNHFKEVNETLGHTAGDRLLIEVAHRLERAVGPDDLVCRLGGDEFAVLFVGLAAPALAVSKAHAALTALSAPMDLDGMPVGIEASGGIAIAPAAGDTQPEADTRPEGEARTAGMVELLRRADVAMYHAKREGRRIATYARSRDTASVGSLTLGGDLARAIAERQFRVDFQPIVDLGSGDTIAAEALARWHHPDRGCLAPSEFLDAIERSGQLPAFADLVLDQALEAAVQWEKAGFPLTVAVNVSPRSLLDPSFPDSIAAALARHEVPAKILVVELTESVTLSQLHVVDEVLSALQALGVRLALDDFGTGYSSLSTLARVPVHELKIDRSFVSAMDTPASGAVVRSTIELARSLDLHVVAEGVETEEQRRKLWELGCPAGQGHLFARPMASNRLLTVLRRGAMGRPGSMAPPIHENGAVIRMPPNRRGRNTGGGQQRMDRSS